MEWYHQLWALPVLLVLGGLVCLMRSLGLGRTDSLALGLAGWAGGAWVLSNVLGLAGALRPVPLRVLWVCLAVGVTAAVVRRRAWRAVWWRGVWPGNVFGRLVSGGILVLAGLALVTAVFAPPVTIDVLNYHLPRQLMWLQQGSLAHFVTVNDRQLMMPPLAEVMGLQFLAVTGGDLWVNLPQWIAYALLPLVVASTVRRLGAGDRLVWLAAWMAACLPMAYLEAANGKNDLQATLWLALLLREVATGSGENGWRGRGLRAGLYLGLALLTKSTTFIYAPPILLAGMTGWLSVAGRWRWREVGVVLVVAVVSSGPFFLRNAVWYGTPLGVHRAEDGGHQDNEAWSPQITASNALRNASLHLAGPSEAWNRSLENAVRSVHARSGWAVDDPRSTCWGTRYGVAYAPDEETVAGAPAHFVVIVLLAPLCWLRGAGRRRRVGLVVLWMTMAAGYCVLLKWQPWGARLQMPVFVTGVIALAVCLQPLAERWRVWLCWLIAGAGALTWWPSMECSSRPLWSEGSVFTEERQALMYQYWTLNEGRDADFAKLLAEINPREVLVLTIHDLTYPLMRCLAEAVPGVHFYGAPSSDGGHLPEVIVAVDRLKPMPLYRRMVDGSWYRLVGDTVADGIYLPEATVRERGWETRLPRFAGWHTQRGLNFQLSQDHGEAEPVVWREMASTSGELDHTSRSGRVLVSLTVENPNSSGGWIEIEVRGQTRRIDLAAASGEPLVCEAWFDCEPGENLVRVRRADDRRGGLRFSRIVCNDSETFTTSGLDGDR